MPSDSLTQRKTLACLCVFFPLAFGLVFLAACQAASPVRTPAATLQPTPTIQPAASTAPAATLSPSPMTSATETSTAAPALEPSATPGAQLCSPLEGVAWADLPGMISNPFHPPRAGSDDPHQAVDFADIGADGYALTGRGVQAVLEGRIAAVVADRFPYGYALMVETPLERLPGSRLEALSLPAPAPTLAVIPALTCPAGEPWHTTRKSARSTCSTLTWKRRRRSNPASR